MLSFGGKDGGLQAPSRLAAKRASADKRAADEEKLTGALLNEDSGSSLASRKGRAKDRVLGVDPIPEEEDEHKVSPPKLGLEEYGGTAQPLRQPASISGRPPIDAVNKKTYDRLFRSTMTSMQKVQQLFERVESELDAPAGVPSPKPKVEKDLKSLESDSHESDEEDIQIK